MLLSCAVAYNAFHPRTELEQLPSYALAESCGVLRQPLSMPGLPETSMGWRIAEPANTPFPATPTGFQFNF
jgi:hypothetical protein